MHINGFVLKRPSPNSKGLVCLRFEGNGGEPYPKEMLVALKTEWHFFWFSAWNYTLKEIPYHNLIDLFVGWDDLIRELREANRTECVVIRGGSETFEPHDLLFYPVPNEHLDIDILYIARFIPSKRCDVALECVHYLSQRNPRCRAVFLESIASEPSLRKWVSRERLRLGLQRNLVITTAPLEEVNSYLNRARLSLFTSDEEGMCRAVLQSLLAERPVLCYQHTSALTRSFYDRRYFHYYEDQTGASVGNAALSVLRGRIKSNPGARRYLLEERAVRFHDLAGWQSELIRAAEPLYAKDGQKIELNDVTSPAALSWRDFWRPFELLL